MSVYEINGPFFFGAAERFKEALGQIAVRPKVLIIRMRDVSAIDSTGMHALRDVVKRCQRDGTAVLLCEVREQPLDALRDSAMAADIGLDNVLPDIDLALARASMLAAA